MMLCAMEKTSHTSDTCLKLRKESWLKGFRQWANAVDFAPYTPPPTPLYGQQPRIFTGFGSRLPIAASAQTVASANFSIHCPGSTTRGGRGTTKTSRYLGKEGEKMIRPFISMTPGPIFCVGFVKMKPNFKIWRRCMLIWRSQSLVFLIMSRCILEIISYRLCLSR